MLDSSQYILLLRVESSLGPELEGDIQSRIGGVHGHKPQGSGGFGNLEGEEPDGSCPDHHHGLRKSLARQRDGMDAISEGLQQGALDG